MLVVFVANAAIIDCVVAVIPLQRGIRRGRCVIDSFPVYVRLMVVGGLRLFESIVALLVVLIAFIFATQSRAMRAFVFFPVCP